MATLELNVEQVVNLVLQLPPTGKQTIWAALNIERGQWWDETLERNEQQIRALCAERGLNWDAMSEPERENFVDDLVHEDRACSS